MKTRECFIAFVAMMFCMPSVAFAGIGNGERIFLSRCAICHGRDLRGTGILAKKTNPPATDFRTPHFKKRLHDYPGVIVSSVILQPNGDLIPRTLRENGVRLPSFAWTVKDFRDLNEYMSLMISKAK
ncbi:cytochrome c [Sphingobium indicum]|uniref:cytochrome c n=1 Tax=Sphingobium TaxID=165695 RepID=UPI000A0745AA|nr:MULTISPECIES: cytochrome c [Sphingobium]